MPTASPNNFWPNQSWPNQQSTVNSTFHSIDACLAVISSSSHNIDAVAAVVSSSSHNIDAYVFAAERIVLSIMVTSVRLSVRVDSVHSETIRVDRSVVQPLKES